MSSTIDIDGATIDYSAATELTESDLSVEKQSLPYTTHIDTIALSNGLLTPHNHDESHTLEAATIDYSAATELTESDLSAEKQSLPYTTHIDTIALSNGLLTPHNHDESHTLEATELSDGEGDIEIENLDTVFDTSAQMGSPNVSCRGKRTVINLWQKAILEDFFRNGMNSASMQLLPHHTAAAEKTGLDCEVVKVFTIHVYTCIYCTCVYTNMYTCTTLMLLLKTGSNFCDFSFLWLILAIRTKFNTTLETRTKCFINADKI